MSSQKATLRSRFLTSLPEADRDRVFSLSRELQSPLEAWAARYPTLMRTVRVPQLSLTLCAAAPFLGVHELLPGACLSMWLFAVDDLLDESPGDDTVREVWAVLERCPSLLREGRAPEPGKPLLEALWDVRQQLEQLPDGQFSAALREHLAQCLQDALDGMRFESTWNPRRSLPALREYLDASRHSVGVLPVYVCMLAAMNAGQDPARLHSLLARGRQAALKIRLANDLRTYERELAEGKINVLRILQHDLVENERLDAAAALEEARRTVEAWISFGMAPRAGAQLPESASRRARSLMAQLPDESMGTQEPMAPSTAGSSRPEHYATNLTAFVCDFYAHHDYHHPLDETGRS